MKKILITFLVFTFVFSFVDEIDAQRRGKKKRASKEDTEESQDEREEDFEGVSLMDKLNIEIKPGNLNFFGNQLTISVKSNAGYKINKIFSAGAGGKLFYDYLNGIGNNNLSVLSYGGLVYGRAKITPTFYIQGEYNLVNYGSYSTVQQETIGYPAVGLGYLQLGYDWSFGLELLAILDERARDRQYTIVEYWINFSHNF